MASIPEGFEAHSFVPFSTHAGPMLYKREINTQGIETGWVGVLLTEKHVGGNNRGHGGLLLTVLDEAMGMNASFYRNHTPVVTLSLTTSFIAPTIAGEFLKATATVSHASKSVAFVEGKAWCGDTLVGTANGVWKYLKKSTGAN